MSFLSELRRRNVFRVGAAHREEPRPSSLGSTMKRAWALHCALLLCAAANSAAAHHSFFPYFYPDSSVTLTGTITQFEARNPHAYLHFDVTDETGESYAYVCESSGITQLERNGIERGIFVPGKQVTVTGQRHRRDPHVCFFRTVQIEDGMVLTVSGAGEPLERSPGTRPGSEDAPGRSIFGNWLLTYRAPSDVSEEQPVSMHDYMTEAGTRAESAYDPFTDDPVFRCNPVGILRVWYAPETPLEIVNEGDRIVLRHEWMDVRRTVYLNRDTQPSDEPRTTLGYSIGRLENSVLTIKTTNFPAGVVSQYVRESESDPIRGLLHSDALTVTETIRFDEVSETLAVTIELEDPVYYTRSFPPVTTRYERTDLQVTPFGCVPEV
jgi:hypothetical protein